MARNNDFCPRTIQRHLVVIFASCLLAYFVGRLFTCIRRSQLVDWAKKWWWSRSRRQGGEKEGVDIWEQWILAHTQIIWKLVERQWGSLYLGRSGTDSGDDTFHHLSEWGTLLLECQSLLCFHCLSLGPHGTTWFFRISLFEILPSLLLSCLRGF